MKTTLEEVKKFNIQNRNKVRGGVIDKPVTIQEKMRWLNIYEIPWCDEYSMPLKSVCSDKLLVKEYASKVLETNIGVETLMVYNTPQEIELDALPNEFILKVNHNSGGTIVCRDKSAFNKTDAISKLSYWLRDDFAFRNGFESHYHWIDRKIFVEKLMRDDKQQNSLFDYKFWCFNGEPKLYTINDGHGHGDIMYYKMDGSEWNLYGVKNHTEYKKPINFNLMVEYAKKLAQPFKFVRVDFYEVSGKVYLGEMTFVPGAAMFHYKNRNDDVKVGNMLKL